ncbi:MAG: hypothetical protein IKN56_05180 [Clostridia bacterium]|nr:hypothetical protein [Clostridia bacterium]
MESISIINLISKLMSYSKDKMEVFLVTVILAVIIIKYKKAQGDTAGQKIDSMIDSAKSKIRELVDDKE